MENKKKGAFWACVKGLRGGDFFSNSVFGGGAGFAGGFFWRGKIFLWVLVHGLGGVR